MYPLQYQRIAKILKKKNIKGSVFVRLKREPTTALFDKVLDDIGRIRENSSLDWKLAKKTDDYEILMRHEIHGPFTNWVANVPADKDSKKVWYAAKATSDNGTPRDPSVIGFELDLEPFTTSSLDSQISSAIGQLLESEPGLIGVEIPQPRDRVELDRYIDAAGDRFRRGQGGRVNAIYLFWLDERLVNSLPSRAFPQQRKVMEISTIGHRVTNIQPRWPLPLP